MYGGGTADTTCGTDSTKTGVMVHIRIFQALMSTYDVAKINAATFSTGCSDDCFHM